MDSIANIFVLVLDGLLHRQQSALESVLTLDHSPLRGQHALDLGLVCEAINTSVQGGVVYPESQRAVICLDVPLLRLFIDLVWLVYFFLIF